MRYNKPMKRFLNLVLIVFLIFAFVNNQEAQAYINPGSGSYIFQTIIGSILAIFALFKKFFVSLAGMFKSKKQAETDGEQDE